jgi:rhodanese-related sulfurtransferase
VAQTLADQGFSNVHPLYGGFDAWRDAGYPLERK